MALLATAEIETPAVESPLHTLKELCEDDLQAVNSVLLEQVQETLPFITQLANHLIQSGGKRLRPLLTLASAALCNYQGKDHIPLAACVEMIHTATLLHDDVVDESQKRRNKPSANALWGNSASVLVGDFLFSKSFVLMVNHGSKEVLKTLSQASSTIAEGEVFQLTQLTEPTDSIEVYLDVIQRKTACLFAAACRVGGLVAQAPITMLKALEDYGHNLGLAFQITDDLLDYN
ncbi:MAG: polyprenyl synthetase family protein, partial [bacterium]|nr:polyprenyl synthetase family protein [bacterium]